MHGYVRRIIPHSSVDGPGNRMAVFLQGCDFNCLYCHNPETIPVIQSGDRYKMTVDQLILEVEKYHDYISGVTFSGGECTLQYDFLFAACKALSDRKISVFIDSNGNTDTERLMMLSKWVDGFMIDLKALDSSNHRHLTGMDNDIVKQNLITLSKVHKLYEIRMVIVPGHNNPENMIKWSAFHVLINDRNIKLKLIKYRAHGVRRRAAHLQMPDDEYMAELERQARDLGYGDVIIK